MNDETDITEAFRANGLNEELEWVIGDEAFDRLLEHEYIGHRDVLFIIVSMGYSYRDVSLVLNRYKSQLRLLQAFVDQQDYNDLKLNYEDHYFRVIAKRLESVVTQEVEETTNHDVIINIV